MRNCELGMTPHSVSRHHNQILPAMRAIQDAHGYLSRHELERFSKESGIPLYRLQEVASYFPHFHLTPPPRITVQVCRDMACHLAGAEPILDALRPLTAGTLRVEGVSCLGRCDRAPAVCIGVRAEARSAKQGREHGEEHFYLGRGIDELKMIVGALLQGKNAPLRENSDAA